MKNKELLQTCQYRISDRLHIRRDKCSSKILLFLTFLIIILFFKPYGFAGTKRHLVIYGNISIKDVPLIAKTSNILVVGDIPLNKLQRIKEINPQVLFLKYHHTLGLQKLYPEWNDLEKKEKLFAHDRKTGERLVAQPYGWYLMDHTNETWRAFLLHKIVRSTGDIYDGVFLDDFWSEFVDKFVSERSKKPGMASDRLIASWDQNLIPFLKELRMVFKKKIFINGAHEKYIPHVDGCMEESFIHSNQKPNNFEHNPSHIFRSIKMIDRLKKYGKHILVQSGSSGEGSGDLKKLFRFCFGNYMLIASENTSFSFQPTKTYQFSRNHLFIADKKALGKAKGPYKIILRENSESENLLPNGSFDKGLYMWDRIAGSPSLSCGIGYPKDSVEFHGGLKRSDMIRSSFIPVEKNRTYLLSAWCRAEKNTPGSGKYKKLGLQGRFYNFEKQKLTEPHDMQFSSGSYEWQPFERIVISPEGAAFFKIRIGFIGDGTGKGWVDKVHFGPVKKNAWVLGREFAKGIVLVNIGNSDATVPISCFSINTRLNSIHMGAKEAVLIHNEF